ncbi:hypothetical protein QAD02_013631 [Eretmocerus hayati]|uniref:Uncharacterized protein n=1 Tax=Eretmocerus hayati TaxID=131215 RepID=A0ACC2P2Q2_9HYME|nr:hypothetical protein QAD02_013631 [Eretmocerus hayati]
MRDGATGVVMSVVNKLYETKMGDQARRRELVQAHEKEVKSQKRGEAQHKFSHHKKTTVMSDNSDKIVGIVLQQRAQETQQSYQVVLSYIQVAIEHHPSDIFCSAPLQSSCSSKEWQIGRRRRGGK